MAPELAYLPAPQPTSDLFSVVLMISQIAQRVNMDHLKHLEKTFNESSWLERPDHAYVERILNECIFKLQQAEVEDC